MHIKKKTAILIILIFTFLFRGFTEEQYNVFFYGVIAPVSQDNQKNITEDLFCAQIRVISNVTLIDRRNTGLTEKFNALTDEEIASLTKEDLFNLVPHYEELKSKENSIMLFSKIDKIEEEIWKCSFFAKNFTTSKIDIVENKFESYYKLLADAKNSIIKVLSFSTQTALSTGQVKKRTVPEVAGDITMTVEGVSGTWSGEEGITKIILMRSGRGFVIFNNGASMNISISVYQNDAGNQILKITQNGNFNASFYPDIPRQKVLSAALTSKPIEWNFILSETGTLTGYKTSLGLDKSGNVIETVSKVQWSKIS